jgi:hypothetical protein
MVADRKVNPGLIKSGNSGSRKKQTVKIYQKYQVTTDFSISIEAFGTGRWFETKSRFLDRRDQLLERV